MGTLKTLVIQTRIDALINDDDVLQRVQLLQRINVCTQIKNV